MKVEAEAISPNDPKYLRELGVEADPALRDKLVITAIRQWFIPEVEPLNPTLML